MTQPTFMRTEIEEIPQAVARLLEQSRTSLVEGGRLLRQRDPANLVTIARGSSDHASAFIKYAVELGAGLPVASVGPSIVSIYGKKLRLERSAAIAISTRCGPRITPPGVGPCIAPSRKVTSPDLIVAT